MKEVFPKSTAGYHGRAGLSHSLNTSGALHAKLSRALLFGLLLVLAALAGQAWAIH